MKYRRKYKFADPSHRNVDLRKYRKIIVATVNEVVPNKHPRVYMDYFSTDPLTHSESVRLGRALSQLKELKKYGTTITTFRLFDGKLYENEQSSIVVNYRKNWYYE